MQSRIQGYMYNITSETDYSERMLPPTPPREKEASLPVSARHVSSRAIIDEAPQRQPDPQQSQYRTGRPLVSSHAGSSSAVFRRGSEFQVMFCSLPQLHAPESTNGREGFSYSGTCNLHANSGVSLLGVKRFIIHELPNSQGFLIQAYSVL